MKLPQPTAQAFLLAAITAAAVIAVVQHLRIETALLWARGRVETAHGCTVLSPGIFDDEKRFAAAASQISEVQRDGPLGMFDTPVGTLWYPLRSWTLPVVVEKAEGDPYRFRSLIKSGDVVIDVGANVGTETRAALAAGARLVVAIEPEPLNLECLRRNLNAEIRERRVIVVPKGAWSDNGQLPFHIDDADAGGSSFVWNKGGPSIPVPVITLDRLVRDLQLPRVNVVKIHAEGAEQQVLSGAAATIRRDHPRIALVLEHGLHDVDTLPAAARAIWPGYRVQTTGCTKTFNRIHPATALLTP